MSGFNENIEFVSLPIIRSHKRKMPGELANDELESDPLIHFKINTYYKVIDNIIGQINSRFSDTNQDLFKDLSLLTHRKIIEIKLKSGMLSKDVFNVFASICQKCIDKNLLINEYCHFVKYYEELLESKQLPYRMHKKKK